MSDPYLDLATDPDREPIPQAEQREQELYERYRRRFKEFPPDFGIHPSQRPAFLKDVAAAIERGRPLRLNAPPGVEV